MPAEILNRFEFILPKIEASLGPDRKWSSRKTQDPETLESEMRAMKFILKLRIVSMEYLDSDEKTCGLCGKEYDNEFKVCGRGESPCCLPCGHIAGHQCLREHLSPYGYGSTKCPFCNVDFPQMYTDPVDSKQPTGDLARADINGGAVVSDDEELSRQVWQSSTDSGVSSHEIKRFLSIDEILARSQSEAEELDTSTEVRDFAAEANTSLEVGEREFSKDRRMGTSPTFARDTMKAIDLIAKNF